MTWHVMAWQVHLSEGSGFNPSADYDYTKSTNENYAVTDVTDGGDGGGMGGVGGSTPSFYGPFADIRSRLDYTYHVHYTEARQSIHSPGTRSLVSRLLSCVKLLLRDQVRPA
jgi:hypothetical protein